MSAPVVKTAFVRCGDYMTFEQEIEHLEFLQQRLLFLERFGSDEGAYKKCKRTLQKVKNEIESIDRDVV